MKVDRGWILAIAALVLAQPACAPGDLSEADRARVEEEVSGFVGSLFAAMNEHDVEAISGHYDGSPEFVYVGCTTVRVGFESVQRLMSAWNQANPDATFDHQILATRVLDRDAAAVTVRAATSDGELLFWTFVARRAPDGWRIAYEHESWSDCPDQRPHPTTGGLPQGELMPLDTSAGA